jgi:pSer/pThr/pTyr-binding forkhead associated (FHA) protein
MEFSYEVQGANTYLVAKLSPTDAIDTLTLNMMTNNQIKGLAKAVFSQRDNDRFLKYVISSKTALKDYFAGTVNRTHLLKTFSGILGTAVEVDEYMIDQSSLLFSSEYIYVEVSSGDVTMICLPFALADTSGIEAKELGVFLKDLMFNLKFNQSEDAGYVGAIVNYLNANTNVAAAELKVIVDGLLTVGSAKTVPASGSPASSVKLVSTGGSSGAAVVSATSVSQSGGQGPSAQAGSSAMPVPGLINRGYPQNPVTPAPAAFGQPPPGQMAQATTPNAAQGFAVPGNGGQGGYGAMTRSSDASFGGLDVPAVTVGEQKMSFFKLMMHYSKENKSIYDAQQQQKKAAKNTANIAVSQNAGKTKVKTKKGNKVIQPAPAAGFAVPGSMSAPTGYDMMQVSAPTTNGVGKQPSASVQATGQHQQQTLPPSPVAQTPSSPQGYVPATPAVQYGSNGVMASKANFGSTTVLGSTASDGTTVLSGLAPGFSSSAFLVRVKTGERIAISSDVLRIGKEQGYADYCINDNSAISRGHAVIKQRDGAYYLMDTNSTNHTFINDLMLKGNEEKQLANGDRVRFANEEFIFNPA